MSACARQRNSAARTCTTPEPTGTSRRWSCIEFIQNFADKDGNELDPAVLGLPPGMPQEVRHVVTFKALSDDQTEMTVTEYGYISDHIVEISKMGLEQCLDKMTASFAET